MRKIAAVLFFCLFSFQIAAFANVPEPVGETQIERPARRIVSVMRKTVGGVFSYTYLLLQKLDVA